MQSLTVQCKRWLGVLLMLTACTKEPLPRWAIYERALGEAVYPLASYGSGQRLCDWQIIGQEALAVYVWVVCQIERDAERSMASMPAVIVLGSDGRVINAKTARDGGLYASDIRSLFPSSLHDQLLNQTFDASHLQNHLTSRRTASDPPLIVDLGNPLP